MPPNPKLEYGLIGVDAKVPAFLQRLKGQYPGQGERQEVQFARPRKQLIDQDDNGPTYVDEDSHDTISKEEYEKLVRAGNEDAEQKFKQEPNSILEEPTDVKEAGEAAGIASKQEPKAIFGAASKRKHAKVIDADEAEPQDMLQNKVDDLKPTPSKTNKTAKKGKKIKLSFEDEDKT